MSKNSKDILSRVSHLEPGDNSSDIYDDWSETYDDHLLDDFGYISQRIAARELLAGTDSRDLELVDYGCGTGLVGEALREAGFTIIDGFNISQGMLDQAAAKQVYRSLSLADLTTELDLDDACYDAGCCIGSMGAGHVGAQHVAELLRPLKPGGLFVIIMNGMYYETQGFEAAFLGLQDEGLWKIRKLEEFNYMTELDRPGWLLVADRL